MNYKSDQMLERERELYRNRIKEMTDSQENEIREIRNRWNAELADERLKIEGFYTEEIKHWQDRAKAAEFQLRQKEKFGLAD
jgi:uncharacterized membrane protein